MIMRVSRKEEVISIHNLCLYNINDLTSLNLPSLFVSCEETWIDTLFIADGNNKTVLSDI
jgi:hypothetical protein